MRFYIISLLLCTLLPVTIFSNDSVDFVEEELELIRDETEKGTVETPAGKDSQGVMHGVNLTITGAIFRNISGNYECNFNRKHSAFIEGFYHPQKDEKFYGIGLHYRRQLHFKASHSRLNSPFWAIHVRHARLKADMKVQEALTGKELENYQTTMVLNTVGVNFGRRWLMGKRFNMTTRVGYGIPILSYTLPENPLLSQKEESDVIISPIAGIDAELSIGIVF